MRFAWIRCLLWIFAVLVAGAAAAPPADAQEPPYFVAYGQAMEEPGNLEINFNATYGTQRGGNDYMAYWTEFEYGATGWWTTEFYLDGQSTFHDSPVFTGFRWENRFHPLMKQHWINPVLYVEYENTTEADKTMKEVVGFDGQDDFIPRNSELTGTAHELETNIILGSNFKGWDVSENFIGEKNLGHAPWEFGYAVGVSRPLRLAATPGACTFCRENIVAGAEMYGGLGTVSNFTLNGTSHYFAPILAWQLPSGWNLRISPTFGLTDASHRFLLRFGASYEFAELGRKLELVPMKNFGFRCAILTVTASVALAAGSGGAQGKAPDATAQSGPNLKEQMYIGHEDQIRAGEKLFRQHCAECHGADGHGIGKAANLQAPHVQAKSPAELVEFLRNGNLWKGMPSWAGMPEERRWQIIAYVKTLRQ